MVDLKLLARKWPFNHEMLGIMDELSCLKTSLVSRYYLWNVDVSDWSLEDPKVMVPQGKLFLRQLLTTSKGIMPMILFWQFNFIHSFARFTLLSLLPL